MALRLSNSGVRSSPRWVRVGRVSTVPEHLHALVDDAAVFPPGNAPLPQAVHAHLDRGPDTLEGSLVGTFVVDDQRLPDLAATLAAGTEEPAAEAPLRV